MQGSGLDPGAAGGLGSASLSDPRVDLAAIESPCAGAEFLGRNGTGPCPPVDGDGAESGEVGYFAY